MTCVMAEANNRQDSCAVSCQQDKAHSIAVWSSVW